MEIKFDFEARDEECAFFALYAGLRMYKEQREKNVSSPDAISFAAAEAYGLLEDLKEQHPKEYGLAEKEYNEVYKNLIVIPEIQY
jgi:hypothetical protein